MTLSEIIQLTNLPFKQKGSRFIASCFIDGTPHPREDKTNARIKDGELWISEEGSECLHIRQWLQLYGDSSKYVRPTYVEPVKIERKFVSSDIVGRTMPSLYKGNLFMFICRKFGADRVRSTFIRYFVGEIGMTDTVFWYLNESGQVLHDSIVRYGLDGKRFKVRGGYRKCKSEDGYTGRGLFGQHLLKDHKGDVCVVESEKTALIMSLSDVKGRLWLATGGSNKTANIREDWKLYPDFDMAGSFWECLGCANKGKMGCIIYREGRDRKKDWGCEFQSGQVQHWFTDLKVEDGWDCADWVLENLIKK